jgi:hypothetical protein
MKGGLDRGRLAAQGYVRVTVKHARPLGLFVQPITHGIVGGALASGAKRPELAVGFFQNPILGYP